MGQLCKHVCMPSESNSSCCCCCCCFRVSGLCRLLPPCGEDPGLLGSIKGSSWCAPNRWLPTPLTAAPVPAPLLLLQAAAQAVPGGRRPPGVAPPGCMTVIPHRQRLSAEWWHWQLQVLRHGRVWRSLQQVMEARSFELPLLRLSMLLRPPSRCCVDAHLLDLRLRRCRRMLLVMLPRVPTPPSSSELQVLHSTAQHVRQSKGGFGRHNHIRLTCE